MEQTLLSKLNRLQLANSSNLTISKTSSNQNRQTEIYNTRLDQLIFCFSQFRRYSFSIFYVLFIVCELFFLEPAQGATSLLLGDSGDAVIQLQKSLQEQGFYNGPIDGYYGEGTEQAVTKFQQTNNLSVDGIAGEETQFILQNRSSVVSPSSTTQIISQTGVTTLGSGFGFTTSGVLGLIVFSGLIISVTSVTLRSDESKKTVSQPFKVQLDLYFYKKYLADLGIFDLNTNVVIKFIHKETTFSINTSALGKGDINLASSDLPKGEYTFVVEGIHNGKPFSKKGLFKI